MFLRSTLLFLSLSLTSIGTLFAQDPGFDIALEEMEISNLGGVQSFAWGQHDGKWLIIGGRVDGLHRRQPFASFDVAGNNNQLIVVDPKERRSWSAPLSSLSNSMQEQLSSTNMEFYQTGEYLYLAGGYGYNGGSNNHTTFDKFTAVKVPEVIEAVIEGKSIVPYFRQITSDFNQITGGHLEKIYDTYYQVGGQKFVGRYNPMGPDHGPGFKQEYTNAIRSFKIVHTDTSLLITDRRTQYDSVNLHRRDYNVVPQIMPNGEQGLTAFSGVFRPDADLPFLNCVNIDSGGFEVNNAFNQFYNHYHCANVAMYSARKNEMHNIFFGGIAQYYDSSGILVQDNNVPFVKTIARVTRDSKGKMSEYKLPISFPDYLGAGAEFIPNPEIPAYPNQVVRLDEIGNDSVLLGYIFGGIRSSAKNIFFINNGTQSTAVPVIYKVYLINTQTGSVHELNRHSNSPFKLNVLPNPNQGEFKIEFMLDIPQEVEVKVSDMQGKVIWERSGIDCISGLNSIKADIRKLSRGGMYYVQLKTSGHEEVRKVILR
ncbi:MAG: T9SS type A sorting domain-containing protein [Flavobacteriales bacterium]|nr:T9SS type A sorting domain-containing protein [Flavobacteriales bacterium]